MHAGTRSIQMLYRTLLFIFLPSFLELLVVCALLAHKHSTGTALIVAITFATYTAWTLSLTQVLYCCRWCCTA